MTDSLRYLDKNGDRSQKTYIVLGCHRSGTSFLAQTLKDYGVDIKGGDGRLEDIRFVLLNKAIINDAGGIWRKPPSREKILASTKKFETNVRELLHNASKDKATWGWKDPRQVITAEGMVEAWLEELDDVYLICIFRRPERTEKSLRRLGQHNSGSEFAKEYARRTIHTIRKFMGIDDE